MSTEELKAKFSALVEKSAKLKENIATGEAKIEVYKQELDKLQKELKEKFGFDTLDQAKEFLTKSEEELTSLVKKFEEELKAAE